MELLGYVNRGVRLFCCYSGKIMLTRPRSITNERQTRSGAVKGDGGVTNMKQRAPIQLLPYLIHGTFFEYCKVVGVPPFSSALDARCSIYLQNNQKAVNQPHKKAIKPVDGVPEPTEHDGNTETSVTAGVSITH